MNKPDTSLMDYKYGIFAKIARTYTGYDSMYWTNSQIKMWCDKNDVYYKSTDKNKFHDFWIKISDEVTIGNAAERWDTYNNKTHPDINDPCENLWDRMYVWFDGKAVPQLLRQS